MLKARLWILAALLAACSEPAPQAVPAGNRQVSDSGKGAYEASLAVSERGAAVAWYDDRDGNAEIYLSLYDAQLGPLLQEQRLTTSPAQSYEADVAWLGDDIAVAWYEVTDDGGSAVKVGLWDSALNPLWEVVLAQDRNGRVPELVSVNGRLFIAWLESYGRPDGQGSWSDIRGAWLNAAGEFTSKPFFISSASPTTWNLNADTLNNVVALVYDAAFETASSELYLTLVFQTTPLTRRLTRDDFYDSKYPDIALNGTTAAISWHDEKDGNREVYLATLDTAPFLDNSIPPGVFDLESSARRITDSPGDSFGAYLAWNGDALGLAWCDNSSGHSDIFLEVFPLPGHAPGTRRQVTHTMADSLIPAIESRAGDFVLAWNEAVIDGHGTDENNTRSEVWMSVRDR